ncbi:hypothetical protein LV82_01229 [Albidovulum inexpectatum]|uniref:Uncharacterized protein n=1 Tax=Albidovulum inexpectatum TaxID=196587 RepID=A0A2S5JI37_9RHOB|nr:hypothetical protein LV82_01229 [Albidovulum inexpectatum]
MSAFHIAFGSVCIMSLLLSVSAVLAQLGEGSAVAPRAAEGSAAPR